MATRFRVGNGLGPLSVTPLLDGGAPAAAQQVLGTGKNAHAVVLSPDQRHRFVTRLGDDQIMQLRVDAASGRVAADVLPALKLPTGFSGRPWAADLHLTPGGRFLHTSERTSSTLAIWQVDAGTGELALVGHQATEANPRGFHIAPRGQWLLVAVQSAHSVSSQPIDGQTGALSHTARLVVGQGPNWVEFIELR